MSENKIGSWLHESVGQTVKVQMISGDFVEGEMVCVDSQLNLVIKRGSTSESKETFVKGSSIRYIHNI